MAGKRCRRQPRSRQPAPGEVRAVLDGYAALGGREVPAVVGRLWEAATCADATPARVYLSRCGCWPGRHVRAPLPAESVRWFDASRAPERDEAEGWQGLPPGAGGAVAFAWRRSGGRDGPPVAVSLVALDARGFAVPDAAVTVGSCAGAVFRAGGRGDAAAPRLWADDEGRPRANGRLEVPWLDALGGKR